MYKLDIDFDSLLPHVIDAYTHVFGEKYRSIITDRVNNTMILYYKDLNQIDNYIMYLDKCKRRELMIRFLDEIGYDVEKYKTGNYTIEFDDNMNNILDSLVGDYFCFSKDADYWVPIRAFDLDNKENPLHLMDNQIMVINFLLPQGHEEINEGNIENFLETDEFKELCNRIKFIREVHQKIYDEYYEWKPQLKELNDFVDNEKNRKKNILNRKVIEFYKHVFNKLPITARNILSTESIDDQITKVLSFKTLSERVLIEAFRDEAINMLRSDEVDNDKKSTIIFHQRYYLNGFGLKPPNVDFDEPNAQEMLKNYLAYINQYDIRCYYPSNKVINEIIALRKHMYNDAIEEFHRGRDDVNDSVDMFSKTRRNYVYIYRNIRKERICVLTGNDNEGFFPIMFFSKKVGGCLAYILLHEFGHAISQTDDKGSGFAPTKENDKNSPHNPYHKVYRMHERFNETIEDILAIEANDYLRSKGIYLIEPKEITIMDNSDHNTWAIVKDLVMPLFQKFREQLLDSYINTDPDKFMKYIGEDNYEELNEVINRVDYLLASNLKVKIKENPNDPIVIEYYEQVEKVKQIYINIDNYYKINFGNMENEGETGIKR